MLSPTPLSLFCTLLLCLPLAVVFTITTPLTTTTTTTTTVDGEDDPVAISTTTVHKTPNDQKGIPKIKPLPPKTPINENPNTNPNLNPETYNNVKIKSLDHQGSLKIRALASKPKNPIKTLKNTTANNATDSITSFPPPPPPPASYYDESDELVFRVAARVNPKPRNPKKIAFMFLTTSSLHLAPLWEAFFNDTPKSLYNIYIHTDPTHHLPNTPQFTGVFAHRVIPSKPTFRFTPTLISAARRLLSYALLHDERNYMFALLSPSCIPLHSFNFTYKTLIKSKKSFIEVLKNEVGAYDRWAARGPDSMLPEVKLEEFRIGSQFWVLTRKHARVVVNDRRVWSKFMQPCVKWDVCYPEENYFPTLLSMEDPRGVIPATLTYVDWRGRSDGHPRSYKVWDVGPELIQRLRSNRPRYGDDGTNGTDLLRMGAAHHPFLFARKFGPETVRALMGIANDVILKD